jgi:hypothetical protein
MSVGSTSGLKGLSSEAELIYNSNLNLLTVIFLSIKALSYELKHTTFNIPVL